MPSEVTRFRMARAIQRTCDAAGGPALDLTPWLEGWEVPAEVLDAAAAQRLDTAEAVWPQRPPVPAATSVAEGRREKKLPARRLEMPGPVCYQKSLARAKASAGKKTM